MAIQITKPWAWTAGTALAVASLALACQAPPPGAAPVGQPGAASAGQAVSGGSAPAETVRIREVANAFFPTAITVKGGSTVRLRIENQDGVNHNLVAVGDIGLKTTEQDPDMTMEVDWAVPARPGTYKVICVYHPGMELQLTIQ